MIQYQKTNLCIKFEPSVPTSQNDVIFQKYSSDVTVMTSSTQNLFLKVNSNPLLNPHVIFGAPMTFDLGVRKGEIFLPTLM